MTSTVVPRLGSMIHTSYQSYIPFVTQTGQMYFKGAFKIESRGCSTECSKEDAVSKWFWMKIRCCREDLCNSSTNYVMNPITVITLLTWVLFSMGS